MGHCEALNLLSPVMSQKMLWGKHSTSFEGTGGNNNVFRCPKLHHQKGGDGIIDLPTREVKESIKVLDRGLAHVVKKVGQNSRSPCYLLKIGDIPHDLINTASMVSPSTHQQNEASPEDMPRIPQGSTHPPRTSLHLLRGQ
ncbi:hypothetical protein AMTR_s00037p00089420 [Amborella trichopoda]|uniref:Uncharacterized protein n=1 Tax=Amborella trichopoda TaxID=13333 RepID=U5D4E3_AMBTC|nr:hypothetical protein AMTR_s00037p00089420 [Amborella trichopoda]